MSAIPVIFMSPKLYVPISRSNRTWASNKCKASWSKWAWLDTPISTFVIGKSLKYQSHFLVGWFRHGSIIRVIPAGDVISAATVKFDAGTYAISGRPAPSRDYILQMWNGTFYQAIATNVGWSAGVNSNSLNATQQGWIGNVGGNSIFKLLVSDPGAGRSKQMNVEAYENNVNTTVRIYITHAPPFSGQVINILSS